MLKFILFFTLFFVTILKLQSQKINVSTNGSGRGTAYGYQNKIVTVLRDGESYTYITHLENTNDTSAVGARVFNVIVSEFKTSTNKLTNKVSAGYTWEPAIYCPPDFCEPHGTPNIVLDKDGFLHIVFGSHWSDVSYKKSKYSLFHSSIDFNVPEEIIPKLKSNKDKWTYPIIKLDDEGSVHVAGSLDSDSDGNLTNKAREVAYVIKKKNSNWRYELKLGMMLR